MCPHNRAEFITTAYLSTFALFEKYWDHSEVRNISITVSSLRPAGNLQLNLFEDPQQTTKEEKIDEVIAQIRSRYKEYPSL
jgi:DNA polymerase V